jgi:ubiquinone/menaquinone biosynthesis C-methylase UbiE
LGRTVIGLDLSVPMLRRARSRLGPVIVRSDAMRMALSTSSIPHAVSVWVVHSVKQPTLLFEEAFRVIQPGGLYVVCSTQRPAPDDEVGKVIAEMGTRVDLLRRSSRPREVTASEVLGWATTAGFTGDIHQLHLQWHSKPSEELAAISHRSWPALRDLSEEEIEQATRPAIDALESLSDSDTLRRATADVLVLNRP